MKPYRIFAPVMNRSCDTEEHRAQFLSMFRRAGITRVFLVMERYFSDTPARRAALELLKTNVAYFHANGIPEFGAWFTGMGHGAPLDHEGAEERPDFPRLVGFGGGICDDTFCIADEGYRAALGDYIAAIAACGVDIIQLDDDLRLGYRANGQGCTCDYHMHEFAHRTGRTWSREELYQAVYSGEPTETRRMWFDLMAEGFYGFGAALRKSLDAVAPTVRLGFCAAPTIYDSDCVDAVKLIRIFAGNTRPYLRGIGAAYWGAIPAHGSGVEDVISLQRMERAWISRDPEIEYYTEGDVYPRPRYRMPAWLLETYDMAMRADGSMDGILKYMFDYVQTPTYETGYFARHEKHAPLYREIEEVFDGGITRGVYIYETEQKLRDAVLPTPAPKEQTLMDSAQTPSIKVMNRMGVPTSFVPNGDAVCVMGLSSQFMPLTLLENGAILDIVAAKTLTERGVDCGLVSVSDASAAVTEHFPATAENEAEDLRTLTDGRFGKAVLREGAEVLSTFSAGEETYPAAWYYENTAGQRFLVYAFDAESIDKASQLLCSYARATQFFDALVRVQGRPCAAACPGNPHLYMIAKDIGENTRAVGLWNCFDDEMLTPCVTLDREIASVTFLNGADGYADGNRIIFTTDIPAHAFAGFAVTLK